jgi:hypothetical protein
MKFYRKQPIEAEQFDGNQKRVFGYRVIPSSIIDAITGVPAYYSILINDAKPEPDDDFPVDDAEVVFEVGDWVIKEPDKIKAISDDVFKQTYAELPIIPKSVATFIERANAKEVDTPEVLSLILGDSADWLRNHAKSFARAWLDGYVVEEEHD